MMMIWDVFWTDDRSKIDDSDEMSTRMLFEELRMRRITDVNFNDGKDVKTCEFDSL